MAGDVVYTIAFYVLAALCLLAAAGVIFQRNLVHSALCMALTFVGIAGLYVLLQADFLAAVQLLVYNGAVGVMIVIGVMLTQRGNMADSSPVNRYVLPGAAVIGGMLAVTGWTIYGTVWTVSPDKPAEASMAGMAKLLFNEYAVAFEAVALLLLVAMIGAITLAKGADE